jgi:transcriptional regulator with XRE-family HTH domain
MATPHPAIHRLIERTWDQHDHPLSHLAALADVDLDTARGWAEGRTAPPPSVWPAIASFAEVPVDHVRQLTQDPANVVGYAQWALREWDPEIDETEQGMSHDLYEWSSEYALALRDEEEDARRRRALSHWCISQREARGLSYQEAAMAAGVSSATWLAIEAGTADLDAVDVPDILAAVGVDPSAELVPEPDFAELWSAIDDVVLADVGIRHLLREGVELDLPGLRILAGLLRSAASSLRLTPFENVYALSADANEDDEDDDPPPPRRRLRVVPPAPE